MSPEQADKLVLEAAVTVLTKQLSALVCACMDEQGKPKAPDKKALMQARQMIPQKFPGTLSR